MATVVTMAAEAEAEAEAATVAQAAWARPYKGTPCCPQHHCALRGGMECVPRTHATAFAGSNCRGNGGDGGGGSGGGGGDADGGDGGTSCMGAPILLAAPQHHCVLRGGMESVPRTHALRIRGRWFEWGIFTDLLKS